MAKIVHASTKSRVMRVEFLSSSDGSIGLHRKYSGIGIVRSPSSHPKPEF